MKIHKIRITCTITLFGKSVPSIHSATLCLEYTKPYTAYAILPPTVAELHVYFVAHV